MADQGTDEQRLHERHRESILAKAGNDPYARSLGVRLTRFEAGVAEATLEIREHMLNAHGTVHGAVVYALADHVFSLACNSWGRTAVSLSTTVHFLQPARAGDVLRARATETKRGHRTGFYRIEVLHGEDLVATMEAVAHRKDGHFIALDRDE